MGGPIHVGGFELSSQIGEGAFSKVYLGASTDPHASPLHRQVAIKIIAVSAAAGKDSKEEYLKKLKKEVRLHKVVTHINVLRLLQWSEGLGNESLWIILEYCHGGDLFDKITPDRGIPEDLSHLYFFQLIAALEYCHKAGIAHRDIKPENMLLDFEGNLKLADFGLAELFRYQGREKKLVEACGSAPYAAPELALGTAYRAEPIDVWSAGVVLFTLLVGNTPWDQPTDASPEYAAYLTGELLQEDPWTRIPDGLMSLLQQILHPQPKQRAKLAEIKSHPWFQLDNPYTNEKGLVADRDLLWDSLMKELNDGGEFETQPASQWSDDSGSGSGSPATLDEDMVGPSRSQATEHLPFSQSQKPSQTFREMGARKRTSPAKKDRTNLRHNLLHSQHARSSQVPQSQRPERQGHANNAVAAVLSQRPRTQASAMVMSSMASSAAKYSQFHAVAPSQVADPNLARWYSLWDVEDIYRCIVGALDELGVQHIDEDFPRGAAIGIQVRDKHNEFIRGTIYIQYEPTEEDYASLAPDADFSELMKQRDAARARMAQQGEDDHTLRAADALSPPTGIGMGGYVVKTLWSGNPGERKRLFKEIQARMPAGLVYAK